MSFSRLSTVVVCGVIVALAGCDGAAKVAHPDVYPAAGIVTYNGAPVADADVTLISPETKKAGWTLAGRTGADGKFTITSRFAPGTDGNGVPAGKYTALVVKTEKIEGPKSSDMKDYKAMMEKKMADQQAAGGTSQDSGPKALVPIKYATETGSTLQVTIEKGGNSDIKLELVD